MPTNCNQTANTTNIHNKITYGNQWRKQQLRLQASGVVGWWSVCGKALEFVMCGVNYYYYFRVGVYVEVNES